jgi:xanthine/CO dehydrogenase XdhC/CoxF family maturation factor
MKEIRAILEAYQKAEENQKMALATVVRVEGSSYRRPGARMLVSENGNWVGGISGGCLEGDALRKAKLAILKDKPSLITYDTTEDDAQQIGVGLGCNGIIDVLIAPLDDGQPNPIRLLENCMHSRMPQILLTVTQVEGHFATLGMGSMHHYTNEERLREHIQHDLLADRLLEGISAALEQERPLTQTYELEEGHLTYFIEYLPPALHLYLFGGNYDVFPMAQLAKDIGHLVTVVANPAKLSRSLFRLADQVLPKDGDITIDQHTACILMAHDYKTDMNNLQKLLQTDVPYIGMLGPRKRTNKMLSAFAERGIQLDDADHERLHSPVGLDIGATSPEEIALSILAEIRAYFAGRQGGFLKERKGTIHERI